MGTSLSGLTPKDTYPALLKTSDNTIINSTLKTISDGAGDDTVLQLSTLRVGIKSDSTVTTQTSSVIQSSTTNANLVIAPNGTGALVASIPDGTATGGNARGQYAVDLQTLRNAATQVGGTASFMAGARNTASGVFSVALGDTCTSTNSASVAMGAQSNATGQYSVAVGTGNSASGLSAVAIGASNTASSNYSIVSGGQTNTASTNTHATVVGGQSNTASGQHSTSSGTLNTASGGRSFIGGGSTNVASGNDSVVIGGLNSSSTNGGLAHGQLCNATGFKSIALSFANNSSGDLSTAIGGRGNTAASQNSFITGQNGNTYLLGQFTIGQLNSFGGPFFGLCQVSDLVANKIDTIVSGATTVLSLDGTGVTNLIIPNGNNRAWNVQVNWVAVVTAITGTATGITVGDVVTSIDLLAFKRIGGVSSASAHTSTATKTMVTTPANYAACAIAYTAGASQEMALTFTGPTFVGGGSVTMRVVARIELTEVAF